MQTDRSFYLIKGKTAIPVLSKLCACSQVGELNITLQSSQQELADVTEKLTLREADVKALEKGEAHKRTSSLRQYAELFLDSTFCVRLGCRAAEPAGLAAAAAGGGAAAASSAAADGGGQRLPAAEPEGGASKSDAAAGQLPGAGQQTSHLHSLSPKTKPSVEFFLSPT